MFKRRKFKQMKPPPAPATLSKEFTRVWMGWGMIGDREVAREAAAKGIYISLALQFIAKRKEWDYSDVERWFKSEIFAWVYQLLEQKQIFKACHILTNIGVESTDQLSSILSETTDKQLRNYIAEHLWKNAKLEASLLNTWRFIKALENSSFMLRSDVDDLSHISILKIDQKSDEWKTNIATVLFFNTYDFCLESFLTPESAWKYLLQNEKFHILKIWVNVYFSKNLDYSYKVPLDPEIYQKFKNLFLLWEITPGMINDVKISDSYSDFVKNFVLNELSTYGIFTQDEKSNICQILFRLSKTQNIANIFSIFEQPTSCLKIAEFYELLKYFCVENQLYEVLSVCSDCNLPKSLMLRVNKQLSLWLKKSPEGNFSSESLSRNVITALEYFADGEILGYLKKNPVVLFAIILFKDLKFSELISGKEKFLDFGDLEIETETVFECLKELPKFRCVFDKYTTSQAQLGVEDLYRFFEYGKMQQLQHFSLPNFGTIEKGENWQNLNSANLQNVENVHLGNLSNFTPQENFSSPNFDSSENVKNVENLNSGNLQNVHLENLPNFTKEENFAPPNFDSSEKVKNVQNLNSGNLQDVENVLLGNLSNFTRQENFSSPNFESSENVKNELNLNSGNLQNVENVLLGNFSNFTKEENFAPPNFESSEKVKNVQYLNSGNLQNVEKVHLGNLPNFTKEENFALPNFESSEKVKNVENLNSGNLQNVENVLLGNLSNFTRQENFSSPNFDSSENVKNLQNLNSGNLQNVQNLNSGNLQNVRVENLPNFTKEENFASPNFNSSEKVKNVQNLNTGNLQNVRVENLPNFTKEENFALPNFDSTGKIQNVQNLNSGNLQNVHLENLPNFTKDENLTLPNFDNTGKMQNVENVHLGNLSDFQREENFSLPNFDNTVEMQNVQNENSGNLLSFRLATEKMQNVHLGSLSDFKQPENFPSRNFDATERIQNMQNVISGNLSNLEQQEKFSSSNFANTEKLQNFTQQERISLPNFDSIRKMQNLPNVTQQENFTLPNFDSAEKIQNVHLGNSSVLNLRENSPNFSSEKMQLGNLFSFRLQENSPLPNFANKDLCAKFSQSKSAENLQYLYYIKKNRPSKAAKIFILEQFKKPGKISQEQIHETGQKILDLITKDCANLDLMSSSVAFLEMLGYKTSNLRAIISTILLINSRDDQKIPDFFTNSAEILRLLEENLLENFDASLAEFNFISVLVNHDLPLRFAGIHNLKFPTSYLIHCAENNLWLQFLIFTQIHNYPLDQVLKLSLHFTNKEISEYLYHALSNEIDPNFDEKSKSDEKSLPVSVDRMSVSANSCDFSPNADVFSDLGLKTDLLKVLIKCHKSEDPPTALLQACQLYKNPLLAILATCYEPDSVVTCWLTWLSISAEINIDVENCSISATSVSTFLENVLQKKYIRTLLESFKIFLPENCLHNLVEFLHECTLLNFETSISHLENFEKCVEILNYNTSIPPNDYEYTFLNNSYWLIGTALKLIFATLGHCFHSKIYQITFLEILCTSSFAKNVPIDHPNFCQISKLLENLSPDIELNLSVFLNESERKNEVIRCVKICAENFRYFDALELAKFGNVCVEYVMNKNWAEKFQKTCNFWAESDAAFASSGVLPSSAADFYVYCCGKLVECSGKYNALKRAYKWLKKSDYFDRKTVEKIEQKIWSNYFLLDDATLKQSYYDKHETNYLLSEVVERSNTASRFNHGLNEEQIRHLEETLGKILESGDIIEAVRLEKMFGYKHAETQILLTCYELAEGKMQPYEISAQQRLLFLNRDMNLKSAPHRRRGLKTTRSSGMSTASCDSGQTVIPIPEQEESSVQDTLTLLETMTDRLKYGSNIASRILMCYRIATNTGKPYQEIVKHTDSLSLLKTALKTNCVNKLEVVHDIFAIFKWTREQITDFIFDQLKIAIAESVELNLDCVVMWDLELDSQFHLILELCSENNSVLGKKLLRLSSAIQQLNRGGGKITDDLKSAKSHGGVQSGVDQKKIFESGSEFEQNLKVAPDNAESSGGVQFDLDGQKLVQKNYIRHAQNPGGSKDARELFGHSSGGSKITPENSGVAQTIVQKNYFGPGLKFADAPENTEGSKSGADGQKFVEKNYFGPGLKFARSSSGPKVAWENSENSDGIKFGLEGQRFVQKNSFGPDPEFIETPGGSKVLGNSEGVQIGLAGLKSNQKNCFGAGPKFAQSPNSSRVAPENSDGAKSGLDGQKSNQKKYFGVSPKFAKVAPENSEGAKSGVDGQEFNQWMKNLDDGKLMSIAVELLVRSHDCFNAFCNMEGISSVLRKSQTVTSVLLTQKNWKLMVRLLTGIGRYTEMNYIFQILKENDQFEFLLKRTFKKDTGLKVALLKYLKKHCPKNQDLYRIVALHFTLFSEVAELWENEAMEMISNLIEIGKLEVQNQRRIEGDFVLFANNESTKLCLNKAMTNLTHAAEYHLHGEKLSRAMRAAKQAELIALQVALLKNLPNNAATKCILKLNPQQVFHLIITDLSFAQCKIIIESYNYQVDWGAVLFEQCVLSGKISYLDDYLSSKPMTITLAQDLTRRFLAKKITSPVSVNAMKEVLKKIQSVHMRYRLASELCFPDVIETLLAGSQLAYLKDTVWKKGYKQL